MIVIRLAKRTIQNGILKNEAEAAETNIPIKVEKDNIFRRIVRFLKSIFKK